MMKKPNLAPIFVVLAVLMLAQVALIKTARAAPEACPIDLTSCEESLSKSIRSNSQHYWCHAKTLKWPDSLRPLVRAEGIISGDPHMGNFAVIPLRLLSGVRSMRFVNIDFDDAGIGPFALDFLRLAIAIKAIERDIQAADQSIEDFTGVRELLEAYKSGLHQKSVPVPTKIENDIAIGVKGYDDELASSIQKRLSGKDKNKISLENSELEARKPNDILNEKVAAQFLPGKKILDIVRVRKQRGGSANQDRFWVLVKDEDSVKRIFEFKGWSSTALENFRKQDKPLAWAESLYSAFWPQAQTGQYAFQQIGSQYFWIREKRKALTDIPYEARKKKDLKFLSEMSLYVANHLGQIHGRQKSAGPYVALLDDEKVSELFRSSVKELMNDYFSKFKIKM
jgi:hypothetical protein